MHGVGHIDQHRQAHGCAHYLLRLTNTDEGSALVRSARKYKMKLDARARETANDSIKPSQTTKIESIDDAPRRTPPHQTSTTSSDTTPPNGHPTRQQQSMASHYPGRSRISHNHPPECHKKAHEAAEKTQVRTPKRALRSATTAYLMDLNTICLGSIIGDYIDGM